MISYWEKTQLLHYDLVVLGGGITGIFCALHFRKNNPTASIAILERGLFSSGASTKNAGFACFGSLSELIEDESELGEEKLLSIIKMRLDGLSMLRETVGDHKMDLKWDGGYELFFDKNSKKLNQIDHINSILKPFFSKDVFIINNKKIKKFGFNTDMVNHLVQNSFEGQLNTGKLMRVLRTKLNKKDITFFSNTELTDFESKSNKNQLLISLKNQKFNLTCNKLAICNNAFATQILPKFNVVPGRGLIILTKPFSKLNIKGSFHYDRGFYYFRNIENRILFGGGRNLDFKKEKTIEFGINKKIKNKLITDLEKFIIPKHKIEIDMEWSGIMAFGKSKIPIIKKESNSVAVGIKSSGMGVAIGSYVGKSVADILLD
ncbi:FAD-dependent oxidoreductase [Bacteroidetes bacterium SCGC AAA795-G10]|nr:FAD-dependent oxidoreductase [Bacteroidetes bacterium SCGC AAA795-G10]